MSSFDDLPSEASRDQFLLWRYPRAGARNPHRMTNPVWAFLARHPEINAWSINRHFDGPSSFEAGPAWCASRFGQSTTLLDGGARVLLGGEHEDYYDPDFWIYNDAIVFDASGEPTIYTYPAEDFAPTDFHSATRAGDRVVLVGGLGHAWARDALVSQVHVLDTTSFAMKRFVTRAESDVTLATATAPGWIHKHVATLSADGRAIRIEGGEHLATVDGETRFVRNADVWSLDVAALLDGRAQWARETARPWRQVAVRRADGERNGLFDFAMLRYHLPPRSDFDRERVERFVEAHGRIPSAEAHDAVYAPPVPHRRVEKDPDADTYPLVVHLVVDGVDVRYHEGAHEVELVVEGALPDEVTSALVSDLEAKLEAFEGGPCVATSLR